VNQPLRFFSPAETARQLKVSTKALRLYETLGLVKPLRSGAGWRAYGPDQMARLFGAVGITLVDFKIEFGRIWEGDFSRIILADEISPDSCRLWDTATNEKLDKDRFRRDLGNVIESYTEVARRLGIMKEMPTVIQGGIH